MARAICRVELHEDESRNKALKITSDEYETLHSEMRRQGFRRYIVDSEKSMWHLPPAEYAYNNGEESADELCEKVKAAAYAAVRSHKRYSYVLTRTQEGRKWTNLKKITVDPDA
jgi:hypothetical protein